MANSMACKYYTERTLGWMLNNKIIVFLTALSFCLLISTWSMAAQRNRAYKRIDDLTAALASTPAPVTEVTNIPTTPVNDVTETPTEAPATPDAPTTSEATASETTETPDTPDTEETGGNDGGTRDITETAETAGQKTLEEVNSNLLSLIGYAR